MTWHRKPTKDDVQRYLDEHPMTDQSGLAVFLNQRKAKVPGILLSLGIDPERLLDETPSTALQVRGPPEGRSIAQMGQPQPAYAEVLDRVWEPELASPPPLDRDVAKKLARFYDDHRQRMGWRTPSDTLRWYFARAARAAELEHELAAANTRISALTGKVSALMEEVRQRDGQMVEMANEFATRQWSEASALAENIDRDTKALQEQMIQGFRSRLDCALREQDEARRRAGKLTDLFRAARAGLEQGDALNARLRGEVLILRADNATSRQRELALRTERDDLARLLAAERARTDVLEREKVSATLAAKTAAADLASDWDVPPTFQGYSALASCFWMGALELGVGEQARGLLGNRPGPVRGRKGGQPPATPPARSRTFVTLVHPISAGPVQATPMANPSVHKVQFLFGDRASALRGVTSG